MWHFKDNKDLVGVAFIDAEIYVHSAFCIKNFILIADITRSVQLLRYQVRVVYTVGLLGGLQYNAYICRKT